MKKRINIFILFLCLLSFPASYAQSWKKLYKKAKIFTDSAKYEEAIIIYEKVLKKLKKKNKHYAEIINNLGLVYKDNEEGKKAKSLIEEALSIREHLFGQNSLEYAQSLNDLGITYEELDNYRQAIIYHKKCISIRKQLKDSLGIAQSLNNLGVCYSRTSNYSDAKNSYKESLAIYQNKLGKSNKKYLNVLNSYAVLLYRMRSLKKSLNIFNDLLKLQLDVLGKKHPSYIKTLSNLGGLYYSLGNITGAIKVLEQARTLQIQILGKNNSQYALIINNLASIYYQRTEYKKAIILLEESLEIIAGNKGKNSEDYARTLGNLGVMQTNLKNHQKALELYGESLEIRKMIFGEKHEKYATTLGNIGSTLQVLGNLDKAEEYSKKALNIIQEVHKTEFHRSYETSYRQLGLIAEGRKNYKKALELYNKSLKCLLLTNTNKKHVNYFKALHSIVSTHFKSGNFATSDSLLNVFFNDAKGILTTNNDIYMTAERSLVEHYIKNKQWKKAEELALNIQQKFKAKYNRNHEFVLSQLLIIYRKKEKWKITEVEDIFNELINLFQEELSQNFRFLSESEQQKYLRQNNSLIKEFFISCIDYILQDNSLTTKFFDLHLATKGILLSNTIKMRKRILASQDSTLVNDFEQWQDAKSLISRVNLMTLEKRKQQGWDLDSLQEISNTLEKDLVNRSQDFAQAYAPQTVTWQDIQQILKNNEAVIELKRVPFREEDKDGKETREILYVAMILTSKTTQYPEVVILKNGQILEGKHANTYYRNINTKSQDLESYERFWLPIQQKLDSLGKFSAIYFSADGIYHELSLHTLYNPKTKKYLHETVKIHQMVSSKVLVNPIKSENKNNTKPKALLMGHPMYNLEAEKHQKVSKDIQKTKQRSNTFNWKLGKFEDLPATEIEVNEIAQTLTKAGYLVDKRLGAEALEEVIKHQLGKPKILHLATHGFFEKPKEKTTEERLNSTFDEEQEAMLNAGLVFTGVNTYLNSEEKYDTEDAVLTALEVSNLDLDDTELVVLSACNTAKGRIVGGEGVYGLQRAFQVAGAQNILMSLWKVEDKATAILISNFYTHWVQSGNAREALTKAQTYLRNYTIEGKKKYAHPYFWGAFVLLEN